MCPGKVNAFRLMLVWRYGKDSCYIIQFALNSSPYNQSKSFYFDSELAGDPEALREPGSNSISVCYYQ